MWAISSSSPSPSSGESSPMAVSARPDYQATCCQRGTSYPRPPSTRTART